MRILAKLIASFFILCVTTLLVLAVLFHTRYSTEVFHHLVTPLLPGELTAKQVKYHWRQPLSLTLTQPNYHAGSQHWQADRLRVQLDTRRLPHIHWLRIDGLSIDLTQSEPPSLAILPASMEIGRVLFNDVNIIGQGWQARQVSAQLDQWQKGNSPWGSVRGRAQWEAKRINWHGIELSDALLDAEPSDEGWQLNGVSFQWQRASLSAQGRWQPKALALSQLTISNAIIDSEHTHQQLRKALSHWPNDTTLSIDRADIRQLSAETNKISVNGLTLSAEQLTFSPHSAWWDHPQLRASFNADYLRWQGQTWEQPLGEVERRDESWIVNQLTSQWQEGFISISGQFSPKSWQIDRLRANGLTLSRERLRPLISALPDWPQQIAVTDLSLKHNEWLALSPQFPVKVDGIDIDGRDLHLHRHPQWQLHNGTLTASASYASINQQWLAEPYLRLEASDGHVNLRQLLLGFPDGQLAASGQWNLNTPSQPWSVQIDGLQVPLSLYQAWFDWPLPLTGYHDLQGQWSGLAADVNSFKVGLNGHLAVTLLDAHAAVAPDNGWPARIAGWFQGRRVKQRQSQSFPFEQLSLKADRGHITGILQGDKSVSIDWPIYQTATPSVR
ncbi:AsmA family protein [Salinivibrio sharmensis]|uniref:AsmA domain-containing protein n=1 Tax=Salinivibrio sharmensis TaxID=390883 RepID=A0ABX3KB01_9GAMM|nr:AsmA family protein [Salinivibrio sharmensis]OOE85938.1 hypothetical protein BZG74_13445 [Salinivibrio sharmensis]